jgi:hypothetical protein
MECIWRLERANPRPREMWSTRLLATEAAETAFSLKGTDSSVP